VSLYDAIDISWSFDGDFAVGRDGDLGDTSNDLIQAKIQEIQSLVKSEIGDWKANPSFAATLSDFRGEPNTREVGGQIERRVSTSLISNNVVRPEDLNVRVVPVGIHEIVILIRVSAMATNRNSLQLGQPVVLLVVYNSVEDSVWFRPQDQTEREYFFRRV
jgi:hypothetical protein